jgi:hypothetical protein
MTHLHLMCCLQQGFAQSGGWPVTVDGYANRGLQYTSPADATWFSKKLKSEDRRSSEQRLWELLCRIHTAVVYG